ncbi:MAG: ZTL protein [Betaproteobacteria bacterium]
MAEPTSRHDSGSIFVLAGCNGAGKSSIGGAALRQAGAPFFDPDEAARQIAARYAGPIGADVQREINGAAWQQGLRLLRRTIARRGTFAFETTLGGHTIPVAVAEAAAAGLAVHIWFVGLNRVELNIERVRRRAARGGHDIPIAKIRERYVNAPANLVRLLPEIAELKLFDNSIDADPAAGRAPSPRLLMHCRDRRIVVPGALQMLVTATPAWAKPIVAAALKLHLRQR